MDANDHISEIDVDDQRATVLDHLDSDADASSAEAEPASAATQVFTTTELLERILLVLPFRSLLRAQLTNKTLLATILQSVKLRRKLYLEPEAVKASLWSSVLDRGTTRSANKDRISIVPKIPFGTSYYDRKKGEVIIRFGRNGVAVRTREEVKEKVEEEQKEEEAMDAELDVRKPRVESVRWQEMLPTQPPIKNWKIVLTSFEDGPEEYPFILDEDEYLTLGRMFEVGARAVPMEGVNHVAFVGEV